jgi:hypothetical protein
MNACAGSVADPFLQSQIASPKLSLDSIARNVKTVKIDLRNMLNPQSWNPLPRAAHRLLQFGVKQEPFRPVYLKLLLLPDKCHLRVNRS